MAAAHEALAGWLEAHLVDGRSPLALAVLLENEGLFAMERDDER
jgi:hypothetical protein